MTWTPAFAAIGSMRPGAELAVLVEQAFELDRSDWDAATAVGVVQGVRRQQAHLAALEARALAVMVGMPEYQICAAPAPGSLGDLDEAEYPDVPGGDGAAVRARARRHAHDAVEVVALEVSAAIRVSLGYARGLVTDAVALATDHPATLEALADGDIDAAKAGAVLDATGQIQPAIDHDVATDSDDEAAAVAAAEALRGEVEAAALDRAGEQTLPQLRVRLRDLVHRADPAAAERRTALGRRDRRVCPPRSWGDGTASMTAVGPLEDLTAVFTAVDAAARHARTGGDPRNLDQLRFDALTGAAGWDALRRGHVGCCAPACKHDGPHTGGDDTGSNHGRPHPGSDHGDFDSDTGGARATSDQNGRGGGNGADDRKATNQRADDQRADGQRGDVGGAAPIATVPAVLTRRLQRRPVAVNVTVPLSVLLGLSEASAELDTATGPELLAASIARALAFSPDATWRRIVTDALACGAVAIAAVLAQHLDRIDPQCGDDILNELRRTYAAAVEQARRAATT